MISGECGVTWTARSGTAAAESCDLSVDASEIADGGGGGRILGCG